MRSGQLAAAVGINVQTLRYYERRGLLPEPRRTLGGYREYDQDAVVRLRVVKAAQRLGFTLDEVAELIDPEGRHPAPDLQHRTRAKLAEVERRLADLARIRDGLREILDAQCPSLTRCTCPNNAQRIADLATDHPAPPRT